MGPEGFDLLIRILNGNISFSTGSIFGSIFGSTFSFSAYLDVDFSFIENQNTAVLPIEI
tara:strand:- start:6418 stop:6594 length:177 start_codon:yes stop_codon:yes gene_type:complete